MLYDYHRLREITAIDNIKEAGKTADNVPVLLSGPSTDFSKPAFQNEVISEVEGVYKRGYFYYGDKRKIEVVP